MNVSFSQHIFAKYLNINSHKNPFTGSRIVPCGRTGRQTDMT